MLSDEFDESDACDGLLRDAACGLMNAHQGLREFIAHWNDHYSRVCQLL
jgi:hypothetical protein